MDFTGRFMNFGGTSWAYLAAAAVAAVVSVAAYLRSRRRVAPGPLAWLIGLRASAAALLILCLLNPTRAAVQLERIRPLALLLIDASQSMSIQDERGQTRWSAAAEAVQRIAPRLEERFDLRVYAFSDRLHRVDIERLGGPNGRSTDILTAVEEAGAAAMGYPSAGAVLISDGGQNSGPARRLAEEAGVSVFAVGVGSPTPPRDIAVSSVQAPPVMFVEEEAVLTVEGSIHGYTGRETLVSLFRGNALIDSQTIVPASDSETFQLTFKDAPAKEGDVRYSARVSPAEGELTEVNNESAASVSVMRGRIRALFIDGKPRHEFAAVRRALGRVPNIDLSAVLLAPPASLPSDSLPGQTGRYPLIGSESVSLEPAALARYDLFIIGGVLLRQLPAGFHTALMEAVEERGAGVAWLAEEAWLNPSLPMSPLEPLLPVSTSALPVRPDSSDFMPRLTEAGRRHPVTQLAPVLSENDRAWSRMPLWTRLYTGLTAKPGAETLVESTGSLTPVLAAQRVGAGKSLFVGSDSTWVWGMAAPAESGEERLFDQFWALAARWLATPASARQVVVSPERRAYEAGETARIEIRAYLPGFQPAANAAVDATVIDPNGRPSSLPVSASENEPGVFETFVRAADPGEYRVAASASVGGTALGEDEAAFNASAPQIEFERAYRDEAFLQALADSTGGAYADIQQIDSILPLLKEETETREIRYRKAVWDNPFALLLIAGLLSAEWALRKRKGLA